MYFNLKNNSTPPAALKCLDDNRRCPSAFPQTDSSIHHEF